MLKRIFITLFLLTYSFGLVIFIDRLLGIYWKKTQKVLGANSEAVYITPEFNFRVKLNNLGFRGKDYPYEKKKGTIRIAVVGDSFTYGWGVSDEDLWVNLLEKKLNDNKENLKFEVINLGVPGAAPYDYLETVKKYVPLFNPDFVFIAVVEGNDFSLMGDIPGKEKSTNRPEIIVKRKELISILNHGTFIPYPYFNFFSESLHNTFPNFSKLVLSSVVYDVRSGFKSDMFKYIMELDDEGIERYEKNMDEQAKKVFLSGGINPALFNFAISYPDYFINILDINKSDYNAKVEILNSFISEIKTINDTNQAATIVVDIPYGVFVSKYYMDNYKIMGFTYNENSWKSNIPVEIAQGAAKNANALLIQNLDLFRENCSDECFWKYDDHLTPKGHKLLAENVTRQFFTLYSQLTLE